MLMRDAKQALFLNLDESTQHQLGNRLLRDLAATASPRDRGNGLKLITSAIEAGRELGFELDKTVETVLGPVQPKLQPVRMKNLLRRRSESSNLSTIKS
jgi:hypothetical protein